MAFSYSDENFTVIGNLCFVHIFLDGSKTTFDIPPAIAERFLPFDTVFTYPYIDMAGGNASNCVGFAFASDGKISCSDKGVGYLTFFFPIDSNK